MARYRRKPVEVEARQYDGSVESWRELHAWTEGSLSENEERSPIVRTRRGWKFLAPGWWIVRVATGVYQVCDDADFRENYEPMGEVLD